MITGSSLSLIQQTRKDLQNRFEMKDLGDLKYFLGIKFSKIADSILMNQRMYELGLAGCKPVATPLEFNNNLTSNLFDECTGIKSNAEDKLLEDYSKYQRLIGRLLYSTMTKPDISFMVQVLSQYMHVPKHMEAALRVVRYVKGTIGLGLFMPNKKESKLVVFCDFDWGAYVETRKAVTGYIIKFGDAVISWK